jgi:transposase
MERMSEREWKRLDVVQRLGRGLLSHADAATILGVTARQVRNLVVAIGERGAAGARHGNAGRAPSNRLGGQVRAQVIALARGKYAGFNDQHLTEKLVEVEGLQLSRPSVQRLLRQAGIGAVRKRRPRQHRARRERKVQAGMMLQWDGSRHDWLEGRGPMLCLMGAVDDATGELLPGAHFVEQECAAGYLRVLHAIAREKGLPQSIYMDGHSSLKRNDASWTLEEELRGKQDPTQVGRALQALAIEPIFALSPQAKGRIERQWGTLQDRLVSELRLAGARNAVQADAVLERTRAEHNRRFAQPAREAASAWRKVAPGTDLQRVCALSYEATVHNDNTVRIAGKLLQIPPGPGRKSYAKARVEVRQLLDGSWRIYQRNQVIAVGTADPLTPLVAHKKRKRSVASRLWRKRIAGHAASLP